MDCLFYLRIDLDNDCLLCLPNILWAILPDDCLLDRRNDFRDDCLADFLLDSGQLLRRLPSRPPFSTSHCLTYVTSPWATPSLNLLLDLFISYLLNLFNSCLLNLVGSRLLNLQNACPNDMPRRLPLGRRNDCRLDLRLDLCYDCLFHLRFDRRDNRPPGR